MFYKGELTFAHRKWDTMLGAIFTEKTVIWIICLFGAIALVWLLLKRGVFSVNVGNLFKIQSEDKKVITAEDVQAALDKRDKEWSRTMATLDGYKEVAMEFDQNVRALLARKLMDLKVVESPDGDFVKTQMLDLAVKLEILVMNTENHYLASIKTLESLQSYLLSKAVAFHGCFDKYSNDVKWIEKATFSTVADWWGIVRVNLLTMLNRRLDYIRRMGDVFDYEWWRIKKEKAENDTKDMLAVLNQTVDFKHITEEYYKLMAGEEDEQ